MKIKAKRTIEQDIELDVEFPLYIAEYYSFGRGDSTETWNKIEAPNKVGDFLAIALTHRIFSSGHEEWYIKKPSYGPDFISEMISEKPFSDSRRVTETEWAKAVGAFRAYAAQALGASD